MKGCVWFTWSHIHFNWPIQAPTMHSNAAFDPIDGMETIVFRVKPFGKAGYCLLIVGSPRTATASTKHSVLNTMPVISQNHVSVTSESNFACFPLHFGGADEGDKRDSCAH